MFQAKSTWQFHFNFESQKKPPNGNNIESPGPLNILSFWIYLLKALYASLLNFSIISVSGGIVGSPTSKRLIWLIWGVLHSPIAEISTPWGLRKIHCTERHVTRVAPQVGMLNNEQFLFFLIELSSQY